MSDTARVLRFLHPPVEIGQRSERVILLVGAAALFAGYDVLIFGLATSQIQHSLGIAENQVAPTLALFRAAAIVALLLAASADLVGRRRLLLMTIFGQAIFTFASAFAPDFHAFAAAQILTRIFGYAEEMLCFVVIAEEVAAGARGWANGALTFFYFTGAGFAAGLFGAVNILPYGWRALYFIGAIPIFLVGLLRRRLPETKRFETQSPAGLKKGAAFGLLKALAREHPARVAAAITAAAAFGFALSCPTFLAQKYLQETYHYTPGQVSAVLIPGGLVALFLSIAAGRLSDRLGRKPVAMGMAVMAGISFFLFFSPAPGWMVAPLWVLGFLGFFSGDALIAGFALEIVPTQYRATVGALRYVVEIGFGAIALTLEGHLYDRFQAHGPAVQWMLAAIPVTLVTILLLPEPAGRTLEEMSGD